MALMNKLVFYQLCRFGIVGLTAAAVHFALVIWLVTAGYFQPLTANAIVFFIAFQVSYSGHRYWTFRGTTQTHRSAWPKLLLVSGTGFFANEGLFYVLLTFSHLPYPIALFLVLMLVPIITFSFSKFWVFR